MSEEEFMLRAVELGLRGAGSTRPNPPVGAVVVKGGEIIGEGYHKRCGMDHAEVAAMKDACKKHGANAVRGATVYSTLEPCSRAGLVGACTDALIEAGVKRVVWAEEDPNPVNKGRAARIFRRVGIACERIQNSETAHLIAPFAKHLKTGLPYVTVKLAMSLDGKIADDYGRARWVSSITARGWTSRLREYVDAVMVGAETIRKDDPSLTCRTRSREALYRAVVTESGNLPPKAKIFTDIMRSRTIICKTEGRPLRAVMEDLGARGFQHVLCEGGMKLARSLAAEDLVDDWVTVLVPIVIGKSPLKEARCLGGPEAGLVWSKTGFSFRAISGRNIK